MQNPPENPWIHIGECPVCVDGLCRIRACRGRGDRESSSQDSSDEPIHFYAICDECEAMWTEPDTGAPKVFPDVDDPRCPVCSNKLYGEQSHWALPQELAGSPWASQAIFDIASPETGVEEATGDESAAS